jgi:uncharacterized NAD-dependent epimerase/dehydratase family protein
MTTPRYLILADDDFGPMTSKTANSVIRYRQDGVVAVLDRAQAGATAQSVLGFGGDIPVVGSIEEGLALGPDAVLVGIAPVGGRLPDAWRDWLVQALGAGCDVWSGLHTFLNDDAVLAEAAASHGRTIHDVRRPPADLEVASGAARELEAFVLQTVGTDCNVGKMTAQLQLTANLEERGVRTRFVPTGQTGIFIEGWGIAVDAVVADFIGGAAERLTVQGAEGADVVMVEGQGSINHPGYSGVTLGLLHGACPDALILAHHASREFVGDYRPDAWLRIPPLPTYVAWYQEAAAMVKPAPVIGIALNTYDLDEGEALAACDLAEDVTGLPATDPVRFGPDRLVDAVLEARSSYLAP